MIHPPPKTVAIAHCTHCGRTRFARWVSRENDVPVRYCTRCGAALSVALYRFERSLQ